MFDFSVSMPESSQPFTPDYLHPFPVSREMGAATMPYNTRPYQRPLQATPGTTTTSTPVDDAEIVTIVHSLMEEQKLMSPCQKPSSQRSRENVPLPAVSCCGDDHRKSKNSVLDASQQQNMARYHGDGAFVDYQPAYCQLKTPPAYIDSVQTTTSPYKMDIKMETEVTGNFVSFPIYSGNCCGNDSSADCRQWQTTKDCGWIPQGIVYAGEYENLTL